MKRKQYRSDYFYFDGIRLLPPKDEVIFLGINVSGQLLWLHSITLTSDCDKKKNEEKFDEYVDGTDAHRQLAGNHENAPEIYRTYLLWQMLKQHKWIYKVLSMKSVEPTTPSRVETERGTEVAGARETGTSSQKTGNTDMIKKIDKVLCRPDNKILNRLLWA